MIKLSHIYLLILSFFLIFAGWLYAKQKVVLYTPKKLAQIEKKYGKKVSKRFTNWKKFVAKHQKKSLISRDRCEKV